MAVSSGRGRKIGSRPAAGSDAIHCIKEGCVDVYLHPRHVFVAGDRLGRLPPSAVEEGLRGHDARAGGVASFKLDDKTSDRVGGVPSSEFPDLGHTFRSSSGIPTNSWLKGHG